MNRVLALIVTLILGLALAWEASKTPEPSPATASVAEFSAVRAMADIDELGRSAHPIDSVRHNQVRDYLIGRMTGLGLETRVQTASSATVERRGGDTAILGGDVQNLIGVLPGRDRSAKAVAVTAHYDSVPNSPGASDDSAGVASALETARAIKAQGVPARDVVFLITDGEEGDLLGARAFYAQDPLAKRIGAVVNMDTRGGRGRTFMFETGRGDGAMIDLYRRTAIHPTSSSLAVFLYEHMPNGTDFTIPKNLGIQGVNFAFMGDEFDYHAASSTPARLEQGALQDMGDKVLAVSRALAFAQALPEKRPDAVYADVFGHIILAYSPSIGWVILVLSLALGGIATAIAFQRGETNGVEVARGVAGSLALLLFMAALFYVARGATWVPYGFAAQRPLLAQFTTFEAAIAALGLGAVLLAIGGLRSGGFRLCAVLGALGVGAGALAAGHAAGLSLHIAGAAVIAAVLAVFAFGRPLRPWSVTTGFLIVAAVFTLAAQILAPTLDVVFAWPFALVAAIACVTALIGRLAKPAALAVSAALGLLGAGWCLALAHGVSLGVGADLPSALALFAWLTALCLVPLLAIQHRAKTMGIVALAAGVVLIAAIALHDPSSPGHPRATDVLYVADLDHASADAAAPRINFYRAATLDRLDPWSKRVLASDGGPTRRVTLSTLSKDPIFVAAARPVAIETTPVTLGLNNSRVELKTGQLRRLQLAVRATAPLNDVRAGGVPVTLGKPGTWTYLIWQASATRDVSAPILSFAATGHGTLDVKYASIVEGWPKDATPLPPRPRDAMAWNLSDSTAEVGTLRQSW